MPNTQTSVPLYASGEVLTAANLNLTNSGIPVFATTVTRDAAFGGANEKVLAEGQFAYIEATNTTQYYDGAAWQSVGASSGLTLITTTSFSAVSSFSLPANTFTSTYTNYFMTCNLDSSANSAEFDFRFRASGTDNTSNNYAWVIYGRSASTDPANSSGGSLLNYFRICPISGTYTSQLQITFMTPQDSGYNAGYNTTGFYFDGLTNYSGRTGSGVLSVTTAYDSATFFPSTGTVTGTYSVYGLAK
jgi:hypothetical protein